MLNQIVRQCGSHIQKFNELVTVCFYYPYYIRPAEKIIEYPNFITKPLMNLKSIYKYNNTKPLSPNICTSRELY